MKRGAWISATLIVAAAVSVTRGEQPSESTPGNSGRYRLNRDGGGSMQYFSRGADRRAESAENRVPVADDDRVPVATDRKRDENRVPVATERKPAENRTPSDPRSFRLRSASPPAGAGERETSETPDWARDDARRRSERPVRAETRNAESRNAEIRKTSAFGDYDPFSSDERERPAVHAEYQKPAEAKESVNVRNADYRRVIAPRGEKSGIVELQPPLPDVDSSDPDSYILPVGFSKPKPSSVNAMLGPQTPTVSVKWVSKGDVNVGQKCEFHLVVNNTGSIPAQDVAVEANFPESVRFVSSNPRTADQNGRTVWKLDSLASGEEQTIAIQLVPSDRGELTATASVRFTGLAAGRFNVKEPMLKVSMSGPTKVMVGDAASQFVEVANPGTGVAKNVAVEAWIPPGLEHPRGERLMMDIGALNPGETRKVRLSLAAVDGGEQTVKVTATSDAATAKSVERLVTVLAPSLKVAVDGPSIRYVGRNASYTIKVSNDGSVPSNNVRVLHRLPDGFQFQQADKGGSYDRNKRTIGWFVGRVDPGKTAEVQAVLKATQLGKQTHRAGAISEQGTRSQTDFVTDVEGTASLTVEIFNPDNPVEVGANTVYDVRVRNTGTKADAKVELVCDLPDGVKLVAARGPTRSVTTEGNVVFSALETLAPGKTAVYRVQVRGTTAGNHRFRVRLRSASIKNPLTFDELTKFYAD